MCIKDMLSKSGSLMTGKTMNTFNPFTETKGQGFFIGPRFFFQSVSGYFYGEMI